MVNDAIVTIVHRKGFVDRFGLVTVVAHGGEGKR